MKYKTNTLSRLVLLIVSAVLTVSCGGSKTPDIKIPSPPPKIITQFDELHGIWQQQGYGFIYEIKANSYIRYDYSSAHCIISEQGSLVDLDNIINSINKNANKQQFSFITHYTLTEFYFDKKDELPTLCQTAKDNTSDDPSTVFDAFWHTFNEHYAFFDIRQMDWLAQYQIYSPQINNNTSEEELFNLMLAMVKPLNDAHTRLGNDIHDESALTTQVPLIAEFESQEQFPTLGEFINHLSTSFNQTITSYLGESQKFAGNNKFNWGELNDAIGYIGIADMAGFGGETSSNFGSTTDTERVEIVNAILDTIFTDLHDKTHIVLDLRNNGGGSDAVAAAIAARFFDKNTLGFSKKARTEEGFTPVQDVYLTAVEQHYFLGPLIILTSSFSASATENFLLAMLERENHIRIGQKTAGVHSDTLVKLLPNGWMFSLSNEVFIAPSGESYEGIGIAPDIEMETFTLATSQSDSDALLDYIIEKY